MQETIEGNVRIFISSTCYDLNQIRKDLDIFILSLGFEPVLSNSPSIAVPENLNKIESCRWLVRTSDILVMIIGGRYGSIDEESGKSVTRIEYEEAISAKIPIFIFVDQEVFDKRKLYSQLNDMVIDGTLTNSKMLETLGKKIEDPRVFELINYIDTEEGGKWIFPFKDVNDIIVCLKFNWSLLFKNLLSMRSEKLRVTGYKNKPILKVSWLINEEANEILELECQKKYDIKNIKKQCKKEIIEAKIITEIENNKDRINSIVENIDYKKLGFSREFNNSEELISKIMSFNKDLDLILNSDDEKIEKISLYFDTLKRAKILSFAIDNSGDVPAEDVIIYINIPKLIKVSEENRIPIFLYKRTEDINAIIRILEKLDSLYKVSNDTTKETLRSSINVGSNLDLTVSNHYTNYWSTTSETKLAKEKKVFIEGERIRINMDINKLKHKFVFHQNSELFIYALSNKKGEIIDMSYRCYADNLPQPDGGNLKIKLV